MMDEEPLHVAPLPKEHAPSRDCPCGPIRSSIAGREILIHRLPAAEIPLTLEQIDQGDFR